MIDKQKLDIALHALNCIVRDANDRPNEVESRAFYALGAAEMALKLIADKEHDG